MKPRGEMPEWPNGIDSKSIVVAIPPRVRIPVSPPYSLSGSCRQAAEDPQRARLAGFLLPEINGYGTQAHRSAPSWSGSPNAGGILLKLQGAGQARLWQARHRWQREHGRAPVTNSYLGECGMQRQPRSGSICTVGTGCCFGYQCEKGAYGGGDAVLASKKDCAAGLERLKGLADQIRELAG